MFSKKKILIIGGNGFVGQNLIETFKSAGAKITVLDKNVGIHSKGVEHVIGDVRKFASVARAVKNKDIVIDLAALRPIESMANPILDLEITCKGALNILESCKKTNPKCKIIFLGSNLEYGKTVNLPATEDADMFSPDTFYGVHKSAVSNYVRIYFQLYSINSTFLRFSNIYGPEIQMSSKMSIVNFFIKLAMKDEEIKIFDDGSQIGDYLYIDDAVKAIISAIESKYSGGQAFNIGFGRPVALIKMAQVVIRVIGKGKIIKVPWPDYYKIPPRDYYANFNKAEKILGWQPSIDLLKGINFTVEKLIKYENQNK